MGFAMRMKLNDQIVKKESFKNLYINGAPNGFSFDVQLAYYRGHYLSDIDLLEVYLDGEKMPQYACALLLSQISEERDPDKEQADSDQCTA